MPIFTGASRRNPALRYALVLGLLVSLVWSSQQPPTARASSFDIANGDVAGLKAALNSAGPVVINLAVNGVYNLTAVDNTLLQGPNGLPVLNGKQVTINGNGAKIVRDSNAPQFRILFITGTTTLALNDLTITGGNDGTAYGAGAIYSYNSNLTINNSNIVSNQSSLYAGGAILTLAQTQGGNPAPYTSTLTINNSTFAHNQASNGGGGAIAVFTSGGSSNNPTGPVTNLVTVSNSTFYSNTTTGSGGAITSINIGSNTINGGFTSNRVVVANSTLADNYSGSSASAIANGMLAFANTTSSVLTVTNTTIVGNVSASNTSAVATSSGTNPPPNLPKAQSTLQNTLLASNPGGNCYAEGGITYSGDHNLEYTGAAGAATCGAGSSVTTTNPIVSLTPANNGGSTQTIALATGSPAIDGGNSTICQAAPINNRDQRGAPRSFGPACDIGAYEDGPVVVTENQDSGDANAMGTLTYALKGPKASSYVFFALTNGNTINVTNNTTFQLPAGVQLVGNCGANGPEIVLNGTGVTGDGLTLKGGNSVNGIWVRGFAGRQLVTLGTGNRLTCSKFTRN